MLTDAPIPGSCCVGFVPSPAPSPCGDAAGTLVPDFMDRIVSAVAEVKDDASDAAAGSEEVSGEGAFWKHNFEELQALRVTAPE